MSALNGSSTSLLNLAYKKSMELPFSWSDFYSQPNKPLHTTKESKERESQLPFFKLQPIPRIFMIKILEKMNPNTIIRCQSVCKSFCYLSARLKPKHNLIPRTLMINSGFFPFNMLVSNRQFSTIVENKFFLRSCRFIKFEKIIVNIVLPRMRSDLFVSLFNRRKLRCKELEANKTLNILRLFDYFVFDQFKANWTYSSDEWPALKPFLEKLAEKNCKAIELVFNRTHLGEIGKEQNYYNIFKNFPTIVLKTDGYLNFFPTLMALIPSDTKSTKMRSFSISGKSISFPEFQYYGVNRLFEFETVIVRRDINSKELEKRSIYFIKTWSQIGLIAIEYREKCKSFKLKLDLSDSLEGIFDQLWENILTFQKEKKGIEISPYREKFASTKYEDMEKFVVKLIHNLTE